MKRLVCVMLATTLLLAAASPAVAAPGGNGKGKGQQMKRAGLRAIRGPHGAANAWGQQKPKNKGGKHALQAAESSGTVSVEASAPVKLTGIANALWHISRNLERMSAQMAAGKRDALPAGLLAVVAKFTAWLAGAGPGGSGEPSDTVEPTATVEPTGTIEPTGTTAPPTP